MDKYLKTEPNTEIKRLVNMQSLLTQYDRQNKCLNEQVLKLLAENKALKLDRLHNSSFKRTLAECPRQSRVDRFPQSNIIDRWKKQYFRSSKEKAIDKIVLKKDEGVQADPLPSNSPPKQAPFKSKDSHRTVESAAFSFGQSTGRIQEQQTEKQNKTPQQLESVVEKNNTPEKIESTGLKQLSTVKESREKSPVLQMHESNSSLMLQEKERASRFSCQEQVREQSSEKSRRSRSRHAIAPSPKVSQLIVSKKVGLEVSQSASRSFIRNTSSQILYRGDSVQKKRFIDVVSRGGASISLRHERKADGCC